MKNIIIAILLLITASSGMAQGATDSICTEWSYTLPGRCLVWKKYFGHLGTDTIGIPHYVDADPDPIADTIKSPEVPFYMRSPKMTIADQMVIEPGAGHWIAWHEFAGDIDSNKIFCEIFKSESDMFKQRGLSCFWLTYQHRWQSCDCEPIDSARLELQARYKYDKDFKRHEDSAANAAIDRFKKNYEAEQIKTPHP